MKRIRRIRVTAASLEKTSRRIVGGPDDEESTFDDVVDEFAVDEEISDEDALSDTLDDVADTVEDIQDSVEDVEEDDIDIELDNNITGHYIAECEGCKGIFISATIQSDQEVEKVSGVCPLCNKETDQYLKWVVVDAKSN